MKQIIINEKNCVAQMDSILNSMGVTKFMLVKDNSFEFLSIKKDVEAVSAKYVVFSDFKPNPLYEDVKKAVQLFNEEGCEAIVAVGGGSCLDTAKCIKLFCKMNPEENYLFQPFIDTEIPLLAIPTTAGTGSESTRYAVIYFEGKKQSIAHQCIIPDYAFLDYTVLKTLPVYQKKCTLLDALCQGIESWWSVNSTEKSRELSKKAVELIAEYTQAYIFENSEDAAKQIMLAANLAGQAINITQTTAAHAMSYKLTSLYQIPHGHAVAVCLPKVWRYMSQHLNLTLDKRGPEYLLGTFKDISLSLCGANDINTAIEFLKAFLNKLDITAPVSQNRTADLEVLAKSVNPVRLSNNPVSLDEDTLRSLYERIVK